MVFFQKLNKEKRIKIKKHHTFKRIFNFLFIRLQLFLRSSYVLGRPYFLVIESTNICNLSCPLCPTGQKLKGRSKGKMSLGNFKKIIDELGDCLYSIRLENWGEPLLNEEIFEMITYAKRRKISTAFNTNLLFLDEQKAKELILSGLDHIKISLDGATPESYAKYRIGGDFNKVINNIKLLVKMRKILNKSNPFIEIQFIIMKHNEYELEAIEVLSKDLEVDSLFIERLRPDMREELFNPTFYGIEKFKNWLPTDENYSRFNYQTKKRKFQPNICSYLWTSAVINWDGSIVPCCSVYDECYDFGNIFQNGFKDIWNGQKYIASRRLIGRHKQEGIETVCANCLKNGIIA